MYIVHLVRVSLVTWLRHKWTFFPNWLKDCGSFGFSSEFGCRHVIREYDIFHDTVMELLDTEG